MYKPEFHRKVDKDLSKLDKPLRKDIRDNISPKYLKTRIEQAKVYQGNSPGLKVTVLLLKAQTIESSMTSLKKKLQSYF